MYYNVTYVIRLYIYPRNPRDTVKITGSFAKFLEYDQALIFSTSWCAEEKQKSLSAVNLVKEKKNGIIIGRTCADGSKQR